jgi:molecular chaperone DnaJ
VKRDYYEVLGVSRECGTTELKAAYRRLAVQFHPDKNAGDREAEEKFKEASEAYSVLSDPEKRARYDRFGHDGLRGSGGAGAGPFGFDASIFSDFSDIFGQFFGGFSGGARAAVGEDVIARLKISFSEAAFGVEAPITIRREEPCETCGGSGAEPGTQPERCATCGGRGQVRYSQGFFAVSRTCPACRGEGIRIARPCAGCGGQGRQERERKITIRIPGGVETGSRLRLAGEGNAAPRGGPAGDLYVIITVEEHELFSREGDDVVVPMEIPFPVLALGGEVEVPTLEGTETVAISPGTPVGKEIRLRHRGMERLAGRGRGDFIVRVSVRVPKPVGKEEKTLLEEYARLLDVPVGKPHAFSRVKKIFES